MQSLVQSAKVNSDSIIIDGLYYSYKGLDVFQDFAFKCESKIVVLRGASGCGKTTLLKLLSGNLTPSGAATMPSTAGSCLVLQEDSLFPWLTGTENITKIAHKPEREFKNHAMYRLLAGFIDRKACHMSYGQRRMIELFRAIVFRPRFLYLDEPFNFLDQGSMSLLVPFLQEASVTGTTVVLSNHHTDDGDMIKTANIFKFDGQFPVKSLHQLK